MFISEDSDDATSSTVIAKKTGPRKSTCLMPVAELIVWPEAITVEVELLATWPVWRWESRVRKTLSGDDLDMQWQARFSNRAYH